MLPKSKRLLNNRDFKRVYQKGSFFAAQYFSVNWLNNRTNQTKVGVVISKKTSNKATERNLIKRRFRELVKDNFLKLPVGADLVVVIKPKSKEASFEELKKDFLWALGKLNEKNLNRRH